MTSKNKIAFAGNGFRGHFGAFAKEAAGFTAAEIASIATSIGVVAVADKIVPSLTDPLTKEIAKHLIEPYLDTVEGTLDKVCKLEECKRDPQMERHKRAEQYAHALVLFIPSFIAAMGTKLAIRRLTSNDEPIKHNKLWQKVLYSFVPETKREWMIFGPDEGVHIGSLLLLNTGAAKHTDTMIRATQAVLEKAGISKAKAHDIAAMSYIWELPNLLGLGAGLASITGLHTHAYMTGKSPLGKMVEPSSPHLHTHA